MDKTYEPSLIETKWYQTWEKLNCFAPKGHTNPFCIMLPPPNVTGSLHMGHAFQDTIMDMLTRNARMEGKSALWQPGTDHAGIATQMVVERQLNQEGSSRHELGRDNFLKRVWEWKERSGGKIVNQLRRLGASADWSRERFTMDEGLSHAVREVFVQLYQSGLIYRGKRLVNWDPVLQTAVSDLEVVNEEETVTLYSISYAIENSSNTITIATTRPETIFADEAIAVNPEDDRYRALVGQFALIPISGKRIPIIADEYVDIAFGTGCVKITPAHDFNDYEVGLRHQLPQTNILEKNATLNELVPPEFQSLDRFVARKKIIQRLKELNQVVNEESHKAAIPRGDRSGAILEPFLTPQWFVKVEELAKPAIEAVTSKKIRFIPETYENEYLDWMGRIKDWCISRQLWWGHRIPAWYDANGKIYVGQNEEAVRLQYSLSADVVLQQDEDVLDTWFSSALWPFSTLGWPQETPELAAFFPTSVLVTGFDIIFFWVARMIMMSLHFPKKVPFHVVYVHGLIQDSEGQKMSKSKGNVLDPLDLIDGISLDALIEKRTSGLMQPQMAEKIKQKTRKEFPDGIPSFGTDALRITFASTANFNRFIKFDVKRLEGYRNFCNKLWNATRFILMHAEAEFDITGPREFNACDDWIKAKFNHMLNDVNKAYADYRFDNAVQAIYDFTWYQFCDWYLEFAKPRFATPLSPSCNAVIFTLLEVFEKLLRVLHPIMPFITEELWQKIAPLIGENTLPSISLTEKPKAFEMNYSTSEEKIEWIQTFINGLRNIRSEMNVSPAIPVPVLVQDASDAIKNNILTYQREIESLIKIKSIGFLNADETPPLSATMVCHGVTCYMPLEGLIDKKAECERLEKVIEKIQKEINKHLFKLDNPQFVERAPATLLAAEKEGLAARQSELGRFQEEYEKVKQL